MNEILLIVAKGFWCGCAAFGFSILFNAPPRSLLPVWIGGFVAGVIKYTFLAPGIGAGVIGATFFATVVASLILMPLAEMKEVPHMVVAIPSIIPLVPGVYAYRSMMGLMKLAKYSSVKYQGLIEQTVYNGVIAMFVILAITVGLAIPLIILRSKQFRSQV